MLAGYVAVAVVVGSPFILYHEKAVHQFSLDSV